MQNLLAAAAAGLAVCALIFGSAAWFRNSMAAEFARGETFGRAVRAAEAAAEDFVRREAFDALLAKTNADAAALDEERDRLEDGLNGLEREISRAGDGPVCIGPSLVRALGGPVGASDARPERP